jgi:hypothetical protein
VQVPIDRDAILTDVTTCWLTRTAGSSARLYKEAGDAFYGGARVGVPTAVAVFPGDGTMRALAERSHNIVRWTEYDRGLVHGRGGSSRRTRLGRVDSDGGRAAGRSSSAASAMSTARSSCGSRPATQSCGLITTSTSGSTP